MNVEQLKKEVSGVKFIVKDSFCGWWTKDGFTNDESKAHVFCGKFESESQAEAVLKHGCQLKAVD